MTKTRMHEAAQDANRSLSPVLLLALFLFALPAGYVGGYLALVDRQWQGFGSDRLAAKYAYGGQAAKIAFTPLNLLDRKIRPKYWDVNVWWNAQIPVYPCPTDTP